MNYNPQGRNTSWSGNSLRVVKRLLQVLVACTMAVPPLSQNDQGSLFCLRRTTYQACQPLHLTPYSSPISFSTCQTSNTTVFIYFGMANNKNGKGGGNSEITHVVQILCATMYFEVLYTYVALVGCRCSARLVVFSFNRVTLTLYTFPAIRYVHSICKVYHTAPYSKNVCVHWDVCNSSTPGASISVHQTSLSQEKANFHSAWQC